MGAIKLAVETFVMDGLYSKVFEVLLDVYALADTSLNKAARNMSDMSEEEAGLRDAGLVAGAYEALAELSLLNTSTTPLEKLGCLRRSVLALSRAAFGTDGATRRDSQPLTSDELIPIIVYLVVKSEVPNWMATLAYVSNFHFSKTLNAESGFYLASFEAAVEHVRASGAQVSRGHVRKTGRSASVSWVNARHADTLLALRNGVRTMTVSSVEIHQNAVQEFFRSVEEDAMPRVRALLAGGGMEGAGAAAASGSGSGVAKEGGSSSPAWEAQLCHPLCDCSKCERVTKAMGAAAQTRKDSAVTVYARDDEGCTALHIAARLGFVEMVRTLLGFGAIINAGNHVGLSPLHLACQRNHAEVTQLLLQYQADVNIRDNDGNTPLHVCSSNGHVECAKLLVAAKCDINAANDRGMTPLHNASKWGYIWIVGLLMKHGALIARNKKNETPIQCAQNKKVADRINELLQQDLHAHSGFSSPRAGVGGSGSGSGSGGSGGMNADGSPGMARTASGIVAMGSRDASGGPSMNNSDSDSEDLQDIERLTPAPPPLSSREPNPEELEREREIKSMFVAIEEGDIELVKFKLRATRAIARVPASAGPSSGVSSPATGRSRSNSSSSTTNNNDSNNGGDGVCHPLCQCPKCQKVEDQPGGGGLLPTDRDDKTRTPLHAAAQHGHADIVQLLLEVGAEPNARTSGGQAALHYACQYNHAEVAEMLLARRSKTNARDNAGNTPLHMCSANGHVRCAQLLLSHGANPNIANKRGDTPLHNASRWDYGDIVRILIVCGARIDSLNAREQTPLQCAKSEELVATMHEAVRQRAEAVDAARALRAREEAEGSRKRTMSSILREQQERDHDALPKAGKVGVMSYGLLAPPSPRPQQRGSAGVSTGANAPSMHGSQLHIPSFVANASQSGPESQRGETIASGGGGGGGGGVSGAVGGIGVTVPGGASQALNRPPGITDIFAALERDDVTRRLQ
eukprot:Opistho-2@42041